MTRLGDTLQPDRGTRRQVGGNELVKRVVWIAIAVAVAAFIGSKALAAVGLGVPYPMVLSVLGTAIALIAVVRRVEIQPAPPSMSDNPVVEASYPDADDGVRVMVRRFDTRLNYVHTNPGSMARTLQPAIIDLIDERLRLAHGVDRRSDPDRARAIVGPTLWSFLNAPVTQRVSPHDMAVLVAQMEAL